MIRRFNDLLCFGDIEIVKIIIIYEKCTGFFFHIWTQSQELLSRNF